MLPTRSEEEEEVVGLDTSLSLCSIYAHGSHDLRDRSSNSEQVYAPPSESARETWPSYDAIIWEGYNDFDEQSNIYIDKLSLRDVARRRVVTILDKMHLSPSEHLKELKNELRDILEGPGGSQQREEYMILQEYVFRRNLKAQTLLKAHPVHLEILVAIKTGIQAFLQPNINLSRASLVEVFVNKRCKNIQCQNLLPAQDCTCEICTNGTGFCNRCMCVICNEFDFEVNTLHWIGCDMCSHWNHTDCAIREGRMSMGTCVMSGTGPPEMLFRCGVCNWKSKVLGWIKDVFECCMADWHQEGLMRELDVVSRIFFGSEDPRGRKLYWKCEEVKIKSKTGLTLPKACEMMIHLLQELVADPIVNNETEEGNLIIPQET